MAEVDLAHLQTWVGRRMVEKEQVAATLMRRLAATLDEDPAPYRDGAPAPDGWHFALFGPEALSRALGPDGHPPRGDFLPPAPLPRRMFAGRRLTFARPLVIGETVTRTATIVSVSAKQGRSGALVFVTARYDFTGEQGHALTEEQDVVYRPAAAAPPTSAAPEGAGPAPAPPADWRETAHIDEAALFRYSAVTFNAHRIHYDRDYAREVEGYRDLVVNAGWTALRLFGAARRWSGASAFASAAVRHISPIYLGDPIVFEGRREGARLALRALQGGRVCVEANIAPAG